VCARVSWASTGGVLRERLLCKHRGTRARLGFFLVPSSLRASPVFSLADEVNGEHHGEHQRDDSKDPTRRTVALNQPPNLHAEALMLVVVAAGVAALGWIFVCANLQVKPTSFPLPERWFGYGPTLVAASAGPFKFSLPFYARHADRAGQDMTRITRPRRIRLARLPAAGSVVGGPYQMVGVKSEVRRILSGARGPELPFDFALQRLPTLRTKRL